VAVRPWHRDLAALQALAETAPERLEVVTETNEVPTRIARCHFAVTAGNSWSLELACVGVPQLIIVQAEPHWPTAQKLEEEGAAVCLGWHANVSTQTIRQAVNNLLSDPLERQGMSRSGRKNDRRTGSGSVGDGAGDSAPPVAADAGDRGGVRVGLPSCSPLPEAGERGRVVVAWSGGQAVSRSSLPSAATAQPAPSSCSLLISRRPHSPCSWQPKTIYSPPRGTFLEGRAESGGPTMAILEARGLVKYYGRRKVVDNVDFNVDIGEVVGLLGPNGAGKTTSFRMTTGQITPNGGRVVFNGQDVTQLPMFKRARLGMGYLSQETSVFRKLTVEQNILAILEAMPIYRPLRRRLKPLGAVGAHRPGTGAVRPDSPAQKTTRPGSPVAKNAGWRSPAAWCGAPLLILLDEPFTGIDPPTIKDIKDIIRSLRNHQIGILVTDHQVREILSITDRSYLIHQGRVFVHGTPQEIVANVEAKKVYIGHTADGLTFENDAGGTAPITAAPVVHPPVAQPTPKAVFHALVEQDRVQSLLERLRTADYQAAAAELLPHGQSAVSALIDALDWPQAEHRRRAFEVLRLLVQETVVFDPFAAEADRQPQLAALRKRFQTAGGVASGRVAS